MNADQVISLLGLEPLPAEGGMWTRIWLDDHGSAIYFLMRPGDFSAMHRLDAPEIWHHYLGARQACCCSIPADRWASPSWERT